MFEKASKLKLRFSTTRGAITTEDLWDLPLTSANGVSLDGIAKALNKQVKESEEESFVVAKSNKSSILELQFEIVKHIINVRLDENARRKDLAAAKAQKEKILSVIEAKQDEELLGKSLDELKKLAEAL